MIDSLRDINSVKFPPSSSSSRKPPITEPVSFWIKYHMHTKCTYLSPHPLSRSFLGAYLMVKFPPSARTPKVENHNDLIEWTSKWFSFLSFTSWKMHCTLVCSTPTALAQQTGWWKGKVCRGGVVKYFMIFKFAISYSYVKHSYSSPPT